MNPYLIASSTSDFGEAGADLFKSAIILALFGFLYFIPALVAHQHKHHNASAIFAVNLFFGWTLLGWIAALIWSMTKPSTPSAAPVTEVTHFEPKKRSALTTALRFVGSVALGGTLIALLSYGLTPARRTPTPAVATEQTTFTPVSTPSEAPTIVEAPVIAKATVQPVPSVHHHKHVNRL
jgi:hypothetical protein